jgi:integrase
MGRRVRKPDWPGLLRETTAAGSARFRVRVEGDKRKRITLPVGPGERGFEEAYWKARAGLQPDAPDEPTTTPEAHRLDHLIDRYLAALEAKVAAGVASPGTLKGHRSLLRRASDVKDPLGRRIGSLSADLPREAFIAVMDSFGEHTGAADNSIKALRAAYRWGQDRGFPDNSPVFSISKQHKNRGGATPWSRGDAKLFLDTHPPGTAARLWFWLAVNTMARIGDTYRLGPGHIQTFEEARFIAWQPAKKGSAPVSVPILPQLEDELSRHEPGATFIQTKTGKPFQSAEALRNRIQKWTSAAGLEKRTQHGVRKGAAKLIAEAGGSQYELMSAMAHLEAATSEVYTRDTDRRLLAAEAISKLRDINFD